MSPSLGVPQEAGGRVQIGDSGGLLLPPPANCRAAAKSPVTGPGLVGGRAEIDRERKEGIYHI